MLIEPAVIAALLSLQVPAVPVVPTAPTVAPQSKGTQSSGAQSKATTRPAKTVEPPSRQALARLLAASHHGGAQVPKMVGFKAQLSISTLGQKKDNITVVIDSTFQRDVVTDRGASDMIRYTIDEGGKRLARGRDERGYWMLSDNKVTPLTRREDSQDKRLVRREISLAKQLLGVLDPAAVLGQLTGKVAVREAPLPVGRSRAADYWVARGIRKDYPYYSPLLREKIEEKGPQSALVYLYVHKQTGMLTAVQAFAVVGEKHRPTGQSELVLFHDYKQMRVSGTGKAAAMLPTRLAIAQAVAGKLEPLVKIEILTSSLNPQLTAADFRRPRGK
ncbi:MAG: hypothetical protein ACYTGW_06065 [Planctomycetota bacterium]|jgi:hypothetical protein